MPETVSSEDFSEWLQHPVTRAYFEVLEAEQLALSYGLAQGAYADDPQERIFMGYVRAIREAINPDNIKEELVFDGEKNE